VGIVVGFGAVMIFRAMRQWRVPSENATCAPLSNKTCVRQDSKLSAPAEPQPTPLTSRRSRWRKWGSF